MDQYIQGRVTCKTNEVKNKQIQGEAKDNKCETFVGKHPKNTKEYTEYTTEYITKEETQKMNLILKIS